MMLGYLLAWAGVDVLVLEKHADFLRDFRGDTVHPSTMEVMHELRLLQEFLRRPHTELRELAGQIAGERMRIADFGHLPTAAKFVALMPQWDFLDFLAEQGRKLPSFQLRMSCEAVALVRDGDRVTGLRARDANGEFEIQSDLVVAADGRASILRQQAGLEILDLGAPIDVLWMRLSRRPDDPPWTLGYIARGHVFVTLDRGDYWQCAFVIPKDGHEAYQRAGIESLREQIAAITPFLADRVGELRSFDDVKLLTVRVDRLKEWALPGLLCIGDAAHAMSPIGGVGINLAIQDAVAAANLLVDPLRRGAPTLDELRAVQRRRMLATRIIQRIQVLAQDNIIGPVIAGATPRVPFAVRLLDRFALLRRIPARIVGLGIRPEHVSDRILHS